MNDGQVAKRRHPLLLRPVGVETGAERRHVAVDDGARAGGRVFDERSRVSHHFRLAGEPTAKNLLKQIASQTRFTCRRKSMRAIRRDLRIILQWLPHNWAAAAA